MVVFRTDASVQIGTGHVMRCLTLAHALAAQGADCQFICREHAGNLIEFIRASGFAVHVLPVGDHEEPRALRLETDAGAFESAYQRWLGATQAQDVEACAPLLAGLEPKWLIVDHYALDASWERALKDYCRRLMVIDDLADRPHACDVLLDQTFGRAPEDYRQWTPADAQVLCGSQYALLRPEFAALRTYSLQRRVAPQLRQLLISMGGVDKDNATGLVLETLKSCPLPAECGVTVVMGSAAPWLVEIGQQMQELPWPTRLLCGVGDMARLMADSDLAIGAAGSTSWERCCLGLPTIMLVLADNQNKVAQGLENAGAATVIERLQDVGARLPDLISAIADRPDQLMPMSAAASHIVDGRGVEAVLACLER